MRQESYYLIRPKEDFVARLKVEYDLSESIAEDVLCVQRLWSKRTSWSKRTTHSAGYGATHITELKLMFLVYVLTEYEDLTDPVFRDIVDNELGTDSLSVATFDEFWTIEYIDTQVQSYHNYEDNATAEILKKFSKTGDDIADDWIDRLLARNI